MSLSIDVAKLPAPAQKILDPAGPAPLRAMAAKGVVPGLKPGDVLAVLVALASGTDAAADQARKTLDALPAPILNGGLAGEVQPAVLDALGPRYADNAEVSEKILRHPAIAPETVAAIAGVCSEPVCELIATNEERLIAHKEIIEKLYLNKNCRMSTADRILELAVRNGLELSIPAFAQAKAAIQGELIAEPTEEPSFDDQQFGEAKDRAEELQIADGEDTHRLNEETGQEEVVETAKPLHAIWSDLRPPAKIRLLLLATMKTYDHEGNVIEERRFDQKALRMLAVRDANPVVATTALETPGISEGEVIRIAGLRNVAEEVLRVIAKNRDWTRQYQVKKNLVSNPRTPFSEAAKWIPHLYESDLKAIAKSKDVPGAIQTAAKQQLQRKGKGK